MTKANGKEIFCAFGVDVDAVGGWLGSYGGEDSPGDISRGVFAGEVGVPRLNSAVRAATTCRRPGSGRATRSRPSPSSSTPCVAAGHEIGVHGYSHENPIAMSREQESEILDHCIDLIETRTGRRPTGYVAPWWEFSTVTNELLLERGHQVRPLADAPRLRALLRARRRHLDPDRLRHSRRADWMKPLVRGEETDLVEIPANWYLDDLPPMMFIKASPNSHGFVNPRHIEEMWRDQFDWVYRE